MKKIKISHWLEYYILLIIIGVVRVTPLKILVYTSFYLARFLALIIPFRRKIVLSNLEIAFPNESLKKRKQIGNKMYAHIFTASLESFKYAYLAPKQKISNFIIDDKTRQMFENIHHMGKGAIFVGGHYGFFEGGGHNAVCFNYNVAFVVANQKNKLTEKLIDRPREQGGIRVIHRKNMRFLLRSFQENYMIALLSDQDAGKKGLFVPFFGKLASTHKNAAVLAIKRKLPLFYISIRRDQSKLEKHHVFLDKIEYQDILSGSYDHDHKVNLLVARYTKMMEDDIRKDPCQYWWVHRRFKTRPPKAD